mgnify:CR=1 FL=1
MEFPIVEFKQSRSTDHKEGYCEIKLKCRVLASYRKVAAITALKKRKRKRKKNDFLIVQH